MKRLQQVFGCLLWIAPLLFLWQVLLRQLSTEWTLNPQYKFGWAIPPLCLYLLWRDLRKPRSEFAQLQVRSAPKPKLVSLGILLCLCYALIRMVQEANPEWRLVSWVLAIDVIGLTVLFVTLAFSSVHGSNLESAPVWLPAFPFLFFLVAVPWPTVIERPVIGSLTLMVAAGAAELLGILGIPSVLHGNLIEVGSGTIGIDEACSGIRSLQASIMVSLFLGELYDLCLLRRFILVVSGVICAVLLNLFRATLLSLLAARNGFDAISTWHDPLGVLVPGACFLVIWCLALKLQRHRRQPIQFDAAKGMPSIADWCRKLSQSVIIPLSLALWIGAVELGTETWYRLREHRLPAPSRWQIDLPREQAGFRQLLFPSMTRQILRFDEGINVTWFDGSDLRWQAIFLRWDPGRTAVHLARNHTPEDCLVAAGAELVNEPGLQIIPVHGLEMPFRTYLARGRGRPAYVFYCLWEDRAACRTFTAEWLGWRSRMAGVLAGQRNSGLRSLELVLWGADNEQTAQTALRNVLNQLVSVRI